jgi:xylan 1,4-beta-xylosidase
MDAISINIDVGQSGKPFNHFYGAVGYANVDYTYTAPMLKMYDHLSSFHNHPRFMRLHNILTAHGRGDYYLLHEGSAYGNPADRSLRGYDTVVMVRDGRLIYNWEVVDRVYDILLEHNFKPIVETHHVPTCLIQPDAVDTSQEPPQDFRLWGEVVGAFAQHLVERYGVDEVSQWYFEIWNEPDNSVSFRTDPGLFMALYDFMEHAIHAIDQTLKTGGPATKQGEGAFVLFEAFLKHCSDEPNCVTSTMGTRVDFISVHCKGGRPPFVTCPSTKVMFDSLRRYLDILKQYPKLASVEFVNDESDVVWAGNLGVQHYNWLNFRNTHYFPGFVCKMITMYCDVVQDEYGANLSIVDSDNCHLQWESHLFSGNRSQFTPLITYPSTDLIKKSVFNSYVLLSRLREKRLAASSKTEGFGEKFGVLPTRDEDSLAILVWNFEDGMEGDVNRRQIELVIGNLPFSGDYELVHYRIDSQHSSAYTTWREMGKPAKPSAEQIKMLREQEGLSLYEPVRRVVLTESYSVLLDLPMHSVSLLLFVPHNTEQPGQPQWIKGGAELGYNGNLQVFLAWVPNDEKDFLYYRLWRRQGNSIFEPMMDSLSVNTAAFTDMDVCAGETYAYKVQAINASGQASLLSDELELRL